MGKPEYFPHLKTLPFQYRHPSMAHPNWRAKGLFKPIAKVMIFRDTFFDLSPFSGNVIRTGTFLIFTRNSSKTRQNYIFWEMATSANPISIYRIVLMQSFLLSRRPR